MISDAVNTVTGDAPSPARDPGPGLAAASPVQSWGAGKVRSRRNVPGGCGDGELAGAPKAAFLGLRRVTCGIAVHKAVDNRDDVRITGAILWIMCGQRKSRK